MATPYNEHFRQRTRPLRITLLIMNLLIMLFPPIYIFMTDDGMGRALAYFIGSPIILIISILIIFAAEQKNIKGNV